MKPSIARRSCAAAIFAALLASILATGCADPPSRFYTLLPDPAGASGVGAASARWELLPVAIPAQVDQPELVVRMGDGTLAMLEFDRWVAPLQDEIRGALRARIAADLAAAPLAAGASSWRIAVDVERFDLAPGRFAHLEAGWTIADGSSPPAPRCHGVFEEAVGPGLPALAAGQRTAVARLGDALAAQLRAAAAGGAATCGV